MAQTSTCVNYLVLASDKKEKPDARKYAALRELMTEFIGVPTTMGMGLLAESLTGLVAKKEKKKEETKVGWEEEESGKKERGGGGGGGVGGLNL